MTGYEQVKASREVRGERVMDWVRYLAHKMPIWGSVSSLKHLSTEDCRPKRVVTLGKNGFIATYLTRYLEKQGMPFEAVAKERVDLIHPSSVGKLNEIIRETDTVVIIAVLSPDKGRDYRTQMNNLRMAENLCELFERRPCAHVIYLSSDAVYDAHKIPLDEDSTREPVELYALMHTAREMMLESVLKAKKIPFCILRPVNIYGLGDPHHSYGPNRFILEAFTEHKITIFGKGEERRCYLYIEDVVRLITLCIEKQSVGAMNLVCPGTITFMNLAKMVQMACPFKVDLEFKPRKVLTVHRPYRLMQVFRFIQNLGRPIGPIVHRPYVCTQLLRAFPDFRFTPVREAIQTYVHRYKDNLENNREAWLPHERSGVLP